MADFQIDAGFEIDEGDENSEWNCRGRTGTIFLIDAAKDMFLNEDVEEDDDIPFKQALKCAHSTITRKVICSDGDLTAVVLFNTRESLNDRTDFSHIYILHDLDRPGAERVLKIEEVLEGIDDKFEQEYGHSSNASINEALWVCQSMFSNCRSKLATRSVLIFTSCDDPHGDAPQKAQQARQRACDMRDSGITIDLLQMGQNFDISKLYKDLIIDREDAESQTSQTLGAPICKQDDLHERVCRLEHKQKATDRVMFNLAPGVEMSVSLYTSITKISIPSKINLWKTTNEEVSMMKKEYLQETGDLVMPSDYVAYQAYGGRKIKFNLDEIRNMSKVYDPGMQLLGFKPIKAIKTYYHIRATNFLYPDEKNVKGSTKMFAALLDRCIAREVAPIVRLVQCKNASVAWAALIPQLEERDDKNCQVSSPGFHVCFLPFADDFRDIEIQNRTRATPNQVYDAKEVMKKLYFRYSPDNFENPDLQTHWRNIEALACNRSQLEDVPDYTVPNYDYIEKTAGKLLSNLADMVFPSGYDPRKVQKKSSSSTIFPAIKPIHKSVQNVGSLQKNSNGSLKNNKNDMKKGSENKGKKSSVKLSTIVFDLETNGLKRKYHNIIQISALDLSDTSSEMFNAYILPSSKFDPKSSAVNGFYMKNGCLCKNEKELNAVSENRAITCFLDWLKGRRSKCILIAHNGTRFDVPRLLDLVMKHNLFDYFVDLLHGFVDTLKIFKSLYPYMDKYNQPHLVKVILDDDYEAHDGIEDVIALAKLISFDPIIGESIIDNIDQTPLRGTSEDDKFMNHSHENYVTLNPLHSPNVTSKGISLGLNLMCTPENESEYRREISDDLVREFSQDLVIDTNKTNSQLSL